MPFTYSNAHVGSEFCIREMAQLDFFLNLYLFGLCNFERISELRIYKNPWIGWAYVIKMFVEMLTKHFLAAPVCRR